jgi:hypothetical protein
MKGDSADLRIGDVLQVEWDERPIRVMMADSIEVFYDALFPGGGWNMARARTAIYYRISTSLLLSKGQRVRTEPLTDRELAMHRPDLPMRVLRNWEADWGRPLSDWPKIDTGFDVESQRIALIPFGPKGAPTKVVLAEAADGQSFSGDELLAAAHGVQTAHCPAVRGVGLFRSGISGGVPSYYLWGAVDKAGYAG